VYAHPTAEIADSAEIGDGTKIWHEAQVRDRVTIGENCILGKGAYIDEDVTIGSNVKIQNRASIYKDCTIEDGVFIGPHVCFTNDIFPRAINPDGTLKSADDWTAGRTVVRFGASIGAGSIILPSRTIGRFALVGAGSVVTRDVPDYGLVIGNPARLVGYACVCGARLTLDGDTGECNACGRVFHNLTSEPVMSPQREDASARTASGNGRNQL
jgi:acetyltransferase-like isoleucine patch superfamily enzyme